MTEIALQQYLQTSLFNPCLSERLKDNILCPLIWCSADRQQEGPPLPKPEATPPTTCISMPLRVELLRDGTAAGHSCVMSPSRHIHIKFFWANKSNATVFTHIFLLTWRSSELFLTGLSLFLAPLSSIYRQQEMRRIYTYAIGLPREKVEDGSLALCGQTATVTTVL